MNKLFKINLQNKTALALAISLSFIAPTQAADFTIKSGQIETTPQTLANDNEVGVIEAGGELNTSATAITASAINNSVTNKGSISTVGNSARGISSTATNATISNQGSISTDGEYGYGIFSNGKNATISNQGSIFTVGDNAYGISSLLIDNAIIINQGSISTSGDYAFGIRSTGSNSTIINQGSISTVEVSALSAYGILSENGNTAISNQGSISTVGQNAYGIYSLSSDNDTISNQGTISTEGSAANGIVSSGVNATISNQGNISTEGDVAYGIISQADDATISNQGTISTVGRDAAGILSQADNATISNQGSISTVSRGASGIYSDGDNATISNQGTISTEGNNAYGIYSSGNNATISNEGSISTVGEDAYGIFIRSDNATINNSGSISASGPGSAAIRSSGLDPADTTLNLLPGSQIIGRIDLGNNDGPNKDTANVYGGSVSANLTFENIENINLFGAGVVTTDVTGESTTITNVITVDTTGESTRGVALAGMTSSVHGIISQRMNQTPQYQPIQLAALEVSPSMLYTERKPIAWAQFFGGKFNRDAEGDALGYDYDHAGVNVGYEWDVTETRFGLMGGFVKSDTDTEASSFSSEANNFYVGAYGNRKFGGISMTGSLIAGYSDFDNKRRVNDNLNGVETATSDFDSFFISPSVTLASAYTLTDHWEFRPSTNLSYSMAWLDGYSETGTTNSNLTVDDRKAKALSVRAQLAAAYLISARSELELRLGLNSRNTDDDDTNVSIGGSQFKFANAGDENVTGGFAGASFRIFNQNNLTLVADLEVGGNSDEDYVAGNLNLEYLF
jgi:hypothetical protein